MLKRFACSALIVGGVLLATAGPARAQQTVNFTAGYFVPLSAGSRVDGDVLNEDRTFLRFKIKDFNGGTFGGEWLVKVSPHIEAGAGVSYFQRRTPSVYANYSRDDNSEIAQDLSLRIIPTAFTVRVRPFDPLSPIQPYFGGGVGLFTWRYKESGDFVDFGRSPLRTVEDTFVASGTTPGAILLAGVKVEGDGLSVGGEVRYQRANAELNSDFSPGAKIDLGGWSYLGTIGFRFK